MDCSPPGSSVQGMSQATTLERVSISIHRRGLAPCPECQGVLAGCCHSQSLGSLHLGKPRHPLTPDPCRQLLTMYVCSCACVCAIAPGRRAGAPPLWQLARSFPVTGPQPLSSPACWEPGFQAWAQSTCPELSAQGLVPLRWGCALPSPNVRLFATLWNRECME